MQVCSRLQRGFRLTVPAGWVHYVYVPDGPSGQMARLLLRIAYQEVGFHLQIYVPTTWRPVTA
jgi:hypothetical protein